MKVAIIEDEKLSAEHLALLLQKIDSTIEVVKYMDTVKAAIQAFNNGLQTDLIFLDIHLADGNSFDIFPNIKTDTAVIFTTAYDHYAVQAFKLNSIDYLLKPIAETELLFALTKYNKQQQANTKQLIESVTAAYKQVNKQYKSRFLVKKGQVLDYIPVDEIHFFETRESLSFLVVSSGSRYPVDYTLDQLETMLPPKDFFRINRKIIVHINAIDKVETFFNGRLEVFAKLLESETRIVSRERVNDFKHWLDN